MSQDLPPSEDVDPGEPVGEIAALVEEPETGFLDRVRGTIHRRIAATHFLDFLISACLEFVEEVGSLVFGLFGRRAKSPGGDANE